MENVMCVFVIPMIFKSLSTNGIARWSLEEQVKSMWHQAFGLGGGAVVEGSQKGPVLTSILFFFFLSPAPAFSNLVRQFSCIAAYPFFFLFIFT